MSLSESGCPNASNCVWWFFLFWTPSYLNTQFGIKTSEGLGIALIFTLYMGVLELKDRCYRELSGGQQQRVLLARALCAAGELLILDEPVTGLDPAAAQELYRCLLYTSRCV